MSAARSTPTHRRPASAIRRTCPRSASCNSAAAGCGVPGRGLPYISVYRAGLANPKSMCRFQPWRRSSTGSWCVTNQIIRQALHPYSQELVIVTKVGARRGADTSWNPDVSRQGLIDAVHDNLRNLGLDALDVVNLRMLGEGHGVSQGSLAEPLTTLAELKAQGLIRH